MKASGLTDWVIVKTQIISMQNKRTEIQTNGTKVS